MTTIALKDATGQISQDIEITLDDEGVRAAITSLLDEATNLGLTAYITSYTNEATSEEFVDSITIGLGDATGSTGYKRYVALLTQTGTSAPTDVVMETGLATMTLSRVSKGVYRITAASGTFTADKTFITRVLDTSATEQIEIVTERIDTTVIEITAKQSQLVYDGLLSDTPIEIRVYN